MHNAYNLRNGKFPLEINDSLVMRLLAFVTYQIYFNNQTILVISKSLVNQTTTMH